MSYEYVDTLSPDDKRRYLVKLGLLGLENCPYKFPADRWINDPKQWPKVEYSDVYHYLIKSPRLFSPEAMENYRSSESHRYFTVGWVQTVFHMKLDSGDVLMKADVKRSYSLNEEPHHTWVALKKSGPVICAHCSCMAGCGETCSHVGAVLYKIEAAVRLGYTSSACTDMPCKWNACFVQNIQPSPIAEIKFYKQTAKDKLKKSTKRLKTMPEKATIVEQEQFLISLSSISDSVVGLSTFSNYNKSFIGLGPSRNMEKLPKTLRTFYKHGNEKESPETIEKMIKNAAVSLKVSAEEVNYVEESTRNQAASAIWHEQRAGRITSSTVHEVLRTNILQPAPSVLKKICQPDMRQLKVPAIQWGNNNEDNAFLLYVNLYTGEGQKPDITPSGVVMMTKSGPHEDCIISKSGFVICEEKPFLGVSPDGCVLCKCCGKGLLEIKCPYKYRDSSIVDALKETDFYIDEKYRLKENHKYYAQVQLQMFVCAVDYVDFLVWTPGDCLIVRVNRNNNFIGEMITKLESLWLKHIVPELITRNLENGTNKENEVPVYSGQYSVQNDTPTYCVCKTTEDSGAMVACDRCDNWYHPECLGLKRLPKKKVWYCQACRKLMRKGL